MIFDHILDLFFPKYCLGCNLQGAYLCLGCANKMELLTDQQCPNCRRRNANGKFCDEKCKDNNNFDQLIVCARYKHGNLLSKLIATFKYKFSLELKENLGEIMAKQLMKFLPIDGDTLMVPVPIHKKRLNYRGFNQARLLADELVKNFSNLKIYDCLERNHHTSAQAKLGKKSRSENLKDTIFLKPGSQLEGKMIILIDDVASTCSTLNECSGAIKSGGTLGIMCIVLGRGD